MNTTLLTGTAGMCRFVPRIGLALLLGSAITGCDKLGMGEQPPVDDGAPSPQQLDKISYMTSANSGPKGRKLYTHLEEAKTCADLQLAMRWNRPPNIESGPFHKKLVYLSEQIPPDLPKQSEVFIAARIERGETQPSGTGVWLLKMHDGGAVQVIEGANYWEKQEQDSQQGTKVAVVQPNKPGRALCGHGVYQGAVGKDPDHPGDLPLFSMLFVIDRAK